MKILIGEISSYKAIVIAEYIRKNYPEIEILTYDYNKSVKHFYTKYCDRFFYINKGINSNEYIKQLAHLVKKTNADILFPVHSSLIGEILKNKSLFGNTLDYCSDFSIYQILHNKNSLLSLAESIDLRVPKTYKSIKEAQFPFVGKPSDRSASEGVFYFFSEKDIIKYGPLCTDEYIFQEYINGFGCGYSLYAKEGEIQNAYGHKRIAEHPISGGSSIIRGPFMHKDMQTAVEKILKKTNWTGFAMFEFKMTKEGEIVLIEVNPRIWGSINQGLQNGINYFESILGKADKIENSSNNVITHLAPQSWLSAFQYLIRGNSIPLRTLLLSNTKADVSICHDLKGFISMLVRKL